MKYGVLGTGMVGTAVASRLVDLGHEVMMGSRSATTIAATNWVAAAGVGARCGTFAETARFGEVLVNATAGAASLEVLAGADRADLDGKVLIDIANPMQLGTCPMPVLSVCNTDSPGEQIQRTYPELRVVKTLNTMNAEVMVNPGWVPGDHCVFLAGDDRTAKSQAEQLLETFGWPTNHIVDLGDITAARATEMFLPMWLCIWKQLGTSRFNIRIEAAPMR